MYARIEDCRKWHDDHVLMQREMAALSRCCSPSDPVFDELLDQMHDLELRLGYRPDAGILFPALTSA